MAVARTRGSSFLADELIIHRNDEEFLRRRINDATKLTVVQDAIRESHHRLINRVTDAVKSFESYSHVMVIGGGAGGTAGGIKVTTFAVIAIAMWHFIKGHSQPFIFKRTIPQTVITQSITMLLVATFYILTITVLLAETQNTTFIKILYEVASAFGTVGVSVGNGTTMSLSANFNDFGKLLITFMMIAGRIGILAFTLAFIGKIEEKRYQYAEGRVII